MSIYNITQYFQKQNIHNSCLILILITFVIFASAYSLSTPAYEGPDEEAHHQLPYSKTNSISSLPDSLVQTNSFYYLILNGFILIIDQPDDSIIVNYEYPFDYKGRFHHGQNDLFPYAGLPLEVHVLRILSIFCGVVTLIFTFKISRIVFGKNLWLSLFSTSLVSLTPTFIWINSVLNTDVFVWMFSTIAIFFILRFIQENFRIKFIIFTGIFTGLAIFSKGNGYFLYPIIFSIFLYLVFSRQISIRNFLKYSILFITTSILSGAFRIPYRIINSIFTDDVSVSDINGLYLLPSDYSPELNYVSEHLLNPIFLHFRLIEFTLSGMGQNVIWIPKTLIFIADGFIVISLVGFLYILIKKKFYKFNIEKNFLVLFLAPVFVFSIMFYNWISSEVGISRYTFPIISIFGIIFTIGFSAFVTRKKIQLLLFIPLLFLGIVNFVNITTIQNELAFGLDDADGDGIANDLDDNSFLYSNEFSDKKVGGTTNGIIERINPANVTDSNPLKNEILRQIRGWSPDFQHLQDLVPANLYDNPDNREYELRNALNQLVNDKKIVSHGDAWTMTVHKVWIQKEQKGISILNDEDFQSIQIDTCNEKLILSSKEEILYYCENNKINIIEPVLKHLPNYIHNGDLIQGKNQPEVYLIQDGKKHHIRTIETFEELGFTIDRIKFVSKETLDEIPTGKPIS